MKSNIVHVLVDMTGSMTFVKNDAIGSLNQFVENLPDDALVSIRLFNSYETVGYCLNVGAREVRPLDSKTYKPSGTTPLYDAIGNMLEDAEDGEKTVFVVLTDGEENSSSEYNLDGVKKLMDDKKTINGWQMVFLLAGVDAWDIGSKLGVSAGNTVMASQVNTVLRMGGTGQAVTNYFKSGDTAGDNFFETYGENKDD